MLAPQQDTKPQSHIRGEQQGSTVLSNQLSSISLYCYNHLVLHLPFSRVFSNPQLSSFSSPGSTPTVAPGLIPHITIPKERTAPSKYTSAPPLVTHPRDTSQGHALGLRSVTFGDRITPSCLKQGKPCSLPPPRPHSAFPSLFPAFISYSRGISLTQSSSIGGQKEALGLTASSVTALTATTIS